MKAKIEIFSQDQGGTIRFKTFNVSGGAPLEELSGGLSQYKDYRIAEEPHKLKPLSVATKEGFFGLELGHSNHEIEKNEAVRIQIRLAIQNHFTKQLNIIRSGRKIKALTLFFIDAVDKVRDDSAPDGRGEYLRIFDEEYKKYVTTHTHELEMNKEYFPDYMNVQAVREGYFARDKKNNAVDVEGWDSSVDDSDVKLKAKSQEDIDRGISLILEKKDELISFEEPLAFIFSHSALREGWDNPNVFTLCTLKAGGSDIAKKQEIGRGLRLPVDNTGNRCIDRRINELTVIANDYYDHFASALQKDFNDNMHFVKDEVTADILIETLKSAGIPEEKISPKLVDTLKEELVSVGVMNNDTKASNITSYEVINGYELDERNIFELDTITEADFEQEWRVFKAKSDRSSAMNEYYKLDSEGESKFAHKLENNENVLLFTKLKKGGFVIDTPYGNYSPDWAVVCRKEALKDPSIGIYFIVETKAGKTWADLTDVEKNKIHCGELHFKAVSDDTKFDWVNGYEDFVNKFGVAESD